MAAPAGKSIAKEVLITRVFEAPLETVFRAWSEAESLKRWYAPKGCTVQACTVDFRVGGRYLTCIAAPGMECWCAGVYKEIVRPERIVSTMHLADEQGNYLEPAKSHLAKYPDWPGEMVLTLTFEALGPKKTRMTLHQTVSEELAKQTGAYPSWLSMFEKLDQDLAGH